MSQEPKKRCDRCSRFVSPEEMCCKYCSARNVRGRGPFACKGCQVTYYTKRPIGEGDKFCSRECAFAARVKKPKQKPIVCCVACSVVIRVGKYCRECKKENARQYSRRLYRVQKGISSVRICSCGSQFDATKIRFGSRHCSKKCARKAGK